MDVILLLLSILFTSYALYCLKQAKHITVKKNNKQERYNQEYELLKTSIDNLIIEKNQIIKEISIRKENIEQECQSVKKHIEQEIELFKNNSSYAEDKYIEILEQNYQRVEEEYDLKIQKINEDKKTAELELQNLQNELSAGVQAQLREREKEEQIDFYRIVLSNNDITDIHKLNQFKLTFYRPMIINKLIWSTYCQKKVTEMCNRILGTESVCGIYKITNLQTKQCYIGQSVNIAERWKQHCKCGCDIDASATNKLYQDMIKTGIWNFSFELMEKCSRDMLNQKELFWIKMYQSDIYGLNSTKGNK